jgi:hypothetical protein
MRTAFPFWRGLRAATAAALVAFLAPACSQKATPSGPGKAAVTKINLVAAATNQLCAQYVSVFEDLVSPKGRDPFYPNSHRRDPVPIMPVVLTEKPPPSSELILKGVVGASNHRLAVINNAILESGETASVRVPSGRVRVKCLEIGGDFAVILVEGEIEPKRLQLTKKGY